MRSNPRVSFELATGRQRLPPPADKPLICHVVVNVERWRFEAPVPRSVLPAPHGARHAPDVPNFSWAEYGVRCGLPRIMRILAERGVRASVSINAEVINVYPAAASAMRGAGWEFIGHGLSQQALPSSDDERGTIAAALNRIEDFTGERPRGWLSPGLQETEDTPDLLKELGIRYVCDWVLDDLPTPLATTHGPLVALPYTLELNDSVVFAVEHHGAGEFERRVRATLDAFATELAENPRVLTLALHPHLIGVPHRVGALSRALDTLLSRDDSVFLTGSQISDWYMRHSPDVFGAPHSA